MKRNPHSLGNLLFLFFTLGLLVLCGNSKAQTIAVSESLDANNNTAATATPILTNPAKIKGNIYHAGDVDFYSFTAAAGDKVYAATQTAFSTGNSTDAQLALISSDGTTVIELDNDNGSFAANAASIAGATIPAAGTYYLRVSVTAATNMIRGYDLYLKVQSGTPTPEVESNDTPASANAVPGSGWLSGARNPAAATEQDWFSITLAAGESVFLSLDCDPERDGVFWNGRLGFALFGDAANQILVVDDATAGTVADPNSEAFFFTAKDAGTYFVFVDASSAAVGGPTATYNVSVSKFSAQGGYTNYAYTGAAVALGPNAAISTATLTIPDNKIIKDISVRLNLNHAFMNDLDATLTAPNGNTIQLFSDIGAAAAGGQQQMDLFLNDNNGVPPSFTVMKNVGYQPELTSKLDQFKGLNTAGVWTLTIYDDASGDGGTLTGWSIDILEETNPVPPTHVLRVNEDFEATDGGFTHSGAADEFEWGTPATVATTTTNPVAGFTTANSGTKCWKTDLDNTYNINSNQVLESPTYNFSTVSGPIFLSWAMRHQMEVATFDSLRVYVEEVGGSGSIITLYRWLGATQISASVGNPTVNIPMALGWGTYYADISAMAGKQFKFKVRLVSDNSVVFGGVAIDDLKIYVAPCDVTSVTFSNQGSCNNNGTDAILTDDFYTADVTVNFINPPTTGNLQLEQSGAVIDVVTVPVASLTGTSHTFTGVRLRANGAVNAVEAEFTVGTCVRTVPAPVVANCSSGPCVLTCPANITRSNDANQCGAVVNYPAPTSSGACGTITASPASGSFFPVGTTTVNVSTTAGPTCSFTVTVNDTQPPSVVCPANITRNTDPNQCGAVVTFTLPTPTDNCPGATVSASPASGSFFPRGTTTVTVTATDAAGNTATCTFTVTVNDTQAPAVTCPANITRSNDPNQCGAVVTFTLPTPTDNCPGATVSASPASGSFFPRGSTTVTVTARDASLNTTTCTFTVTVNDTQNPTITCPAPVTVSCTSAVPAANPASATAADNCPGVTVSHVGDVISAQTCPNRYTITRTYRATDASGNTATCTQTITVNDQTAPVITCPANITATTPIGSCTAVVNFTPTATDNCGGAVTITSSPASGTAFPIGTTTVTSTATDACGNSSSCTFTVTVLDGQLPVITTQPANRTVCTGTNTSFTVTATNAVSYQWQQWNGTAWVNVTGATTATLNLNGVTTTQNTNTYRVNVIGLCTTVTSGMATLFVNPLPSVNITSSVSPVLLPTQSTNLNATVVPTGGTFVWQRNGTAIAGATGATLANLTVDNLGTYRVIYTDPNGCVNTSNEIVISAEESSLFFVAPNPNQGQFWVRYYTGASEQVVLTVYDAKGVVVYQKSSTTTQPYTRIDVNLGLVASGSYVVELRGSNGKRLGSKHIWVGNR